MQKFLIVNCKGVTLEQAIVAMHENLVKLQDQPDTADLQIFSTNFVNTFEKPQRSSLDLNGQQQPVIIYNFCVVLVKPVRDPLPDWDDIAGIIADRIADKLTGTLDDIILGQDGEKINDVPTDTEVQEIKRAAAMFCQHTRLDPAKHSKAHRNIGQWFQLCLDCGAEVWSGITDEHPAPGAGMHAVPGDQVRTHGMQGE
jgi:hypothetical protein